MRARIILTLVIVCMVLISPITAQTADSGETTIEELYLQSTEIKIINEQARTTDRDMKLMALENIQEMIDEGRLSTGAPDAHYVLDYLAGEGTSHTIREANRLVNYWPEVRRRSANLLGKLGGENSKDTLVLMIVNDDEPMVLAEAVYALGIIGLNEDNDVSGMISDVVLSQDIIAPDNNFAFASLLAFEKLAKRNGGIDDPAAFEAIISIAQGNYIKEVRLKAVQVLNELRTY